MSIGLEAAQAGCKESVRRKDQRDSRERDVNADPAAPAYPLEAAPAQLTGLVDDYDEDDINHRR
jgi:hypothetical protein